MWMSVRMRTLVLPSSEHTCEHELRHGHGSPGHYDGDMINDMLDSPMRVEDSPCRLEDEMHVDHSYASGQNWVEIWDENWPGLDEWHNFGE